MGYAGGSTSNHPTYTRLGDHIETLEVEFNPTAVPYSRLLDVFRSLHDPTSKPWLRQYSSALMPLGEQLRTATDFVKRMERETGRIIHTLLLPDPEFYVAEDYHQKHYLQSRTVIYREVRAAYQTFDDMVASKRAAVINGYAGGFGSLCNLERDMELSGLSKKAREALLHAVARLSRR